MKYLKLYEADIFDDYDQDFEEEDWVNIKDKIEIDNVVYTVDNMYEDGYLYFLEISNSKDSESIFVTTDREYAGRVARKQYEDLDKEDLIEIIGKDNLVSWAFGEPVQIGSTIMNSLEEWFQYLQDNPEESLSGDGLEHKITNCSDNIIKQIKDTPKIAYFH